MAQCEERFLRDHKHDELRPFRSETSPVKIGLTKGYEVFPALQPLRGGPIIDVGSGVCRIDLPRRRVRGAAEAVAAGFGSHRFISDNA